jgi:hypothetical protein
MYTATEFTPLLSLAGGLLIGASALIMLAFNGRIAGISGIVGNLFNARGADFAWRAAFTVGLILGALVFVQLAPPGTFSFALDASLPTMLVGGFIVGVGTRMGKGCTSGHGVCGIGRVSPRSLVATMVFMTVAGVTVFVVRHLIGA